jgi:hypothetical protein
LYENNKEPNKKHDVEESNKEYPSICEECVTNDICDKDPDTHGLYMVWECDSICRYPEEPSDLKEPTIEKVVTQFENKFYRWATCENRRNEAERKKEYKEAKQTMINTIKGVFIKKILEDFNSLWKKRRWVKGEPLGAMIDAVVIIPLIDKYKKYKIILR